VNEWDGTSWAGTVTKAETGSFVANLQYGTYLSVLSRSPQKIMCEAQALYHSNLWIRTAESVVTRKAIGLPWHLEDAEDEEIPDNASGELGRIVALLEKPQAALPPEQRQEALVTHRALWSLTSRHIGLCGMAYWYLDQIDGQGIPLAILYVNPARVWPVETENGRIIGWVLDAKDATGRGGTPVPREQLLPFYLDPPDQGAYGQGLVAAAWQKAQITNLADRHAAYVLGTGGRLAGIVAPKVGSTILQEQYEQLVREFRVVNEAPDAAKRTTIVRGPIDFIQTAADPAELALIDLSKMNRDDILAVWGVPPSQAGIPTAGGLNSGETRKYDEAVLMQGAVHDRVQAIRETIQYRLLDRWQPALIVDLEIEEPAFDDRTPAFELAKSSLNIPLTNEERRALIGLDPTGDEIFDKDVLLPVTLVSYSAGSEPEPVPTGLPFGKATAQQRRFLGLRRSVETRFVPALRKMLGEALRAQAKVIATKVRARGSKDMKQGTWWGTDQEDERLAKVLRPSAAGIAEIVTKRTDELLSAGKAEGFEERVAARLVKRTGERITGINATTRDAVAAAIEQGFADGLSPAQVGDLIEGLPAFDVARAELVARTESMFAYNDAALGSYGEFGVAEVEAVDGDKDEECAARNGRTFSLADAAGIEDHPNGTLDWVPIVGRAYLEEPRKAEPMVDAFTATIRAMQAPPTVNIPAPIVNIEATPAPVVNVAAPAPSPAPVVNVPAAAAPIVNIDMAPVAAMIAELKQAFLAPRTPLIKTVIRDKDGRIEQVVEA